MKIKLIKFLMFWAFVGCFSTPLIYPIISILIMILCYWLDTDKKIFIK